MKRNLLAILFFLILPSCTTDTPSDPIDPVYQAKRLESRMEMWRESQNLEAMLQMSKNPDLIGDPEMKREIMVAREIWEESIQEYAKQKEKEGELVELPQTMTTPEYATFNQEARIHYRAILKIYMERMEEWRAHEEFVRREEEEREDFYDRRLGRSFPV